MRSSIAALAILVLALSGCPSAPEQPRFDSGPSTHDAGSDAGSAQDTGSDASAPDAFQMGDAGLDAATDLDTNVADAGVSDAGVDANITDANITDAGTDTNRPDANNACVNAGGSCVGLAPANCMAPLRVGDATMYSCGTGVGVECCLPATPSPVCMFAATAQEGWYQPDGSLICLIGCDHLTAVCQRVGTASAGWYTTSDNHGCPPHVNEIIHDDTCR